MRIIHFADTHLGYADYPKTDPATGLNQREVDVYSAFNQIIDYILDAKPDLVVHAGDLFDSVRPSNRAIHEAFRQFVRLSRVEIPTVIIAGNHSTPRQKVTGSIFRLLEYLPHIHPVFEGEYKPIEIGDAKVHAIPHAFNEQMFKENFLRLAVDKSFKYNILVTHATVIGVTEFAGAEFKELAINRSYLSPDFDYIALGHMHRFIKVAENAFYSGSPERLSFSEAQDAKGFLDVELGSSLKVTHMLTKARDMVDLAVDCADLDAFQVMKAIEASIPADISGKLVRLTLRQISPNVYMSLDNQRIKEMTAAALHFVPKPELRAAADQGITTTQIGALAEEFAAFVRRQALERRYQESVEKLGLRYLEEALPEMEE